MSFIYNNDKPIPSSECNLGIKQLNQKGNIVYEYNPLKVLRLNEDTDEFPKNSLVDLDTDKLNFDLEHPVDILTQQSYDGSVNLIINDGKNAPKLINTRFSTTGMNTYQIVDREGDNDSNIYDENTFDSEVSLYKIPNTIVKLDFIGLQLNGSLKVGNYSFYFKLSDADGNESDIVAESGKVSCYVGNINDPHSIRGGLEDENSFKSANFIMSNIDSSYSYVSVYYTRSSSGYEMISSTLAYKIEEKFPIYNGIAKINITGFEPTLPISVNDLNIQYNLVSNAKTQVECQNMLFLGNVNHEEILYKELSDISLRFVPTLSVSEDIGWVNENYYDESGKYEYYNANNVYNKLGYWNDEIYRFGIVYILNDNSLTPVFNVRGINELTTDPTYTEFPYENDNEVRNYIPIDKSNHLISVNENSKGVVKINYTGNQFEGNKVRPIGIKFNLLDTNDKIKSFLKENVKGYFFVRQKRLKTTFCQAALIGYDRYNRCPTLPISGDKYLEERFLNNQRLLTHDFNSRKIKLEDKFINKGNSAICPEYELNSYYFNNFFTGSEFVFKKSKVNFTNNYFNENTRHLYNLDYESEDNNLEYKCNIVGVSDNIAAIKNKNAIYSSRAGEAEYNDKFAYCGYKNETTTANNLMRGAFGPYIGIENNYQLGLTMVDIKIPGYNSLLNDEYFDIRYRDMSPFYAISDRFEINKLDEQPVIYRGDCYIGNFTHRMIRNFQDTEAPYNDIIVEDKTWVDNYCVNIDDLEDTEDGETAESSRAKINRMDLNAVKIGHWVTFKVCSNINLSLRCNNPYNASELALSGRERSFHPLQSIDISGEGKIPESNLHNSGYDVYLGDQYHYESPDIPAIKNKFHTRILYSDISVNDSFKNGFRTFRGLNYRDYPTTYGSLIKMLEWYGYLICIMEHGIMVLSVNERALISQAEAGDIFVSAHNVLPETPLIISDMIGSQWADSIIQTPYGIYGVDTVAKKIWKIAYSRSKGFNIAILSDFKVQKFLNENINLSEKELTPFLGVRNVKTHHNAFKNDIMFTFYDDINTIEERVWNLCYNEVLEKFITFYSWVPSFSANIDNIFFTFDRDTSKQVAKLYNTNNAITLDTNVFIDNLINSNNLYPEGSKKIGNLLLNNNANNDIEFSIEEDLYDSHFTINNNTLSVNSEYLKRIDNNKPVIWTIPIKATIKSSITQDSGIDIDTGTSYGNTIYSNLIICNEKYLDSLENTKFWKHGFSGLMKTKDDVKPCKWYDKQHPFEFEVIVVDNPGVHKIFTDLQIVANRVSPESLHFEISGESYTFADDKKNMFFRQEALKNLYQYYGSDISYDSNYLKIIPEQRDIPYSNSKYKDKSTMFPVYYSRIDTLNQIEDYYQNKSESGKDYQKISGSEIVYDKARNQFNIATHIKACPFETEYLQEISLQKYNEMLSKGYKNIKMIPVNEKDILTKDEYHRLLNDGETVYASALMTNQEGITKQVDLENINFENLHCIEYLNGSIHYTDGDTYYTNVYFFRNIPDNKYYEIKTYGRLNGNMHYKEDSWYLQIPSIVYLQKNEEEWTNGYPPLNIANNPVPEDMPLIEVTSLPNNLKERGYNSDLTSFDPSIWESRKETRIRDRYMKVKIRYTGNDLAIIYALRTMFTINSNNT